MIRSRMLLTVGVLWVGGVAVLGCDKVSDEPPPPSAAPPAPLGPGMFGQRNRFRQPAQRGGSGATEAPTPTGLAATSASAVPSASAAPATSSR